MKRYNEYLKIEKKTRLINISESVDRFPEN